MADSRGTYKKIENERTITESKELEVKVKESREIKTKFAFHVHVTEEVLNKVKPVGDAVKQKQIDDYQTRYLNNGIISIIKLDDLINAHVIQTKYEKSAATKKAVIFLYSSKDNVATSLHHANPLIKFIKQVMPDDNVHFIGIDYIGNGFNQSDRAKCFNKIPPSDDINAVLMLVKRLIDGGEYKIAPSDIYFIAQSYGATIGLSVMHALKAKYPDLNLISVNCPNDKLISERVAEYIHRDDQEKAIRFLKEDGVLPEVSLDEMLIEISASQPCFVFQVKHDKELPWQQRLYSSCPRLDAMKNRFWELDVSSSSNTPAHFAPLSDLQFKTRYFIIDFHVLCAAIISNKNLALKYKFTPFIDSNELTLNLQKDAQSYMELPLTLSPDSIKSNEQFIFVTPMIKELTKLIETLCFYCKELQKEALASGKGDDFKRGQAKVSDWNARQKIEMAIKILALLTEEQGPNIDNLLHLQYDTSFTKDAGKLKTVIYEHQVLQFIKNFPKIKTEMEKEWREILENFNHIISQSPAGFLKVVRHTSNPFLMYPRPKEVDENQDVKVIQRSASNPFV